MICNIFKTNNVYKTDLKCNGGQTIMKRNVLRLLLSAVTFQRTAAASVFPAPVYQLVVDFSVYVCLVSLTCFDLTSLCTALVLSFKQQCQAEGMFCFSPAQKQLN